MIVDVPPRLIKGRGCPVTGMSPDATDILTIAWNTIIMAIPMIRNAGKARVHFFAIIPALMSRDR